MSLVNPFLLSWSFQKSVLRELSFDRLEMSESEFVDCQLMRCRFIRCDLKKSQWQKSMFHEQVFFEGCNLEEANFTEASGYEIDPVLNNIKRAKFQMPEAIALLAPFEIVLE